MAGKLVISKDSQPFQHNLNSIVTVRSQIILREIEEPESSDTVIKEISEPSGSEELNGELSFPNSRVGMSSGTVKSSRPKPKVADARVYSYDEIIERREKLNDSDEYEFNVSDVEKNL